MNRISIHQDQQEWKETLSDAEMQELLSVRGITVSRTSEILKAKSPITVSSALKKIWMRKHFSELPPQDNARLVAFTNAWVMALLEQLKPTNRKKTTGQENISPIKPREPGILFADFEKEFRKIPNRPSIMSIWTQLIQHYPAYIYHRKVREFRQVHLSAKRGV